MNGEGIDSIEQLRGAMTNVVPIRRCGGAPGAESVVRVAGAAGGVHYAYYLQYTKKRYRGERLVCACTQRLSEPKLSLERVTCSFCTSNIEHYARVDVTDELLAEACC